MVTSDGHDYVHTKLRSVELKDTTHYDKVWKIIVYTELKMIGDHSTNAAHYDFIDTNNVKVGEVTFDSKGMFVGGRFYDFVIVKGRTLNARQAFARYIERIEETHG